MSPGSTMLRVYSTLKRRIMAGEFAPGERLDPKRLALDLLTSTSPVRDALHRLQGERLVQSWRQEGFRQPQILESAIRDLYEWSGELMQLVARAASRTEARPTATMVCAADYPDRVSECFMRIAHWSPNREHWIAVASVIDRSALFRNTEQHILADALLDVERIDSSLDQRHWPDVEQSLMTFHQRRVNIVSNIASELRSSDQE